MKKLFGTSGIRGIYGKSLTLELALDVGYALGTSLAENSTVLIGRDTRTSSFAIENSIIAGLESTGVFALRAGIIPTPVLGFSTRELKADAGVMVTASHNPPEYNGIKLWNDDSSAYSPGYENQIEKLVSEKKFRKARWEGIGKSKSVDVIHMYAEQIKKSVNIQKLHKAALDCGGGAACTTAPLLLESMAESLAKIFCEPSGTFECRASEPTEENISLLMKIVKKEKTDIGFAYDGDADRVSVVDEKGNYVQGDAVLALIAKKALEEQKGIIAVPVDTSKLVKDIVEENNGTLIETKVGDVNVSNALKIANGIFGGEACGAFIFPEVHYAPDGILSSLKLLELLSKKNAKLSELVGELPVYQTLRKTIKCKESEKEKTMEKIENKIRSLKGAEKIITIDGIKAEFSDSWILARTSGTESKIRVTVEARETARAKELLKSV